MTLPEARKYKVVKTCVERGHDWRPMGWSTFQTYLRCRRCGAARTEERRPKP